MLVIFFRTNTTQETFDLLIKNFNDHYMNGGQKAPFGVFAHSAWLEEYPGRLAGYEMYEEVFQHPFLCFE